MKMLNSMVFYQIQSQSPSSELCVEQADSEQWAVWPRPLHAMIGQCYQIGRASGQAHLFYFSLFTLCTSLQITCSLLQK